MNFKRLTSRLREPLISNATGVRVTTVRGYGIVKAAEPRLIVCHRAVARGASQSAVRMAHLNPAVW